MSDPGTQSAGEESASRPRITLVCTGKTHVDKGEIGLVFRDVNPDGSTGAERVYDRRNLKHVRVGAVYDVETGAENPNSIYVNSIRWLRLWPDESEAAGWQLVADAFDTRELAVRQERKETGRRLFIELLEPIRKQYWATNAAGRLAIEVRILAYLKRVPLSQGSD